MFRVDRVQNFQIESTYDKEIIKLKNWHQDIEDEKEEVCVRYLIQKGASRMHQSEWVNYHNYKWENEFEEIKVSIPKNAISYFAQQLLPLGSSVKVLEPQELIDCIINKAQTIINSYK